MQPFPLRFLALLLIWTLAGQAAAEPLKLHLRSRQETAPQSGRYHALTRPAAVLPLAAAGPGTLAPSRS